MKNARIPELREAPSLQSPDAPPADDRQLAQRLIAAFDHLRESIVLTDPDDRFVLRCLDEHNAYDGT